jgi:hypothetical protein
MENLEFTGIREILIKAYVNITGNYPEQIIFRHDHNCLEGACTLYTDDMELYTTPYFHNINYRRYVNGKWSKHWKT